MTPNEKAAFAREALENRVLKLAFEEIRQELIGTLETCPFGDIDTQHEIALTLQLLKRIHHKLYRFIEDQKVEQKKQEQQKWIEKARQRLLRA